MNIIMLLTEAVTIEIKGVKPERIVNELAIKGIDFTGLIKLDDYTIQFKIQQNKVYIINKCVKKYSLDMSVIKRGGMLHFLKRFKKRYVLISMPVLCLLGVLYLSTFIWEIEVTGNKTVPTSEIIKALEENGVGIGTNGMWLNNEIIRSETVQKIKKLSWLTVRVSGSRALVIVRERKDRPELIDENIPSEILAAKTGVIDKIYALAGNAVVKNGDTVVNGQVLITGELKDKQEQVRRVRSLGEVWARTWYEKKLVIPVNYIKKSYTGRVKTKTSVKICNLRLNFYFNSGISYKYYDKITTEKRPAILGLSLPFSIITSTFREYEVVSGVMEDKQAGEMLQDRLLQWVLKESDNAKLTDAQFESDKDEKSLTVSVLAECYEQIGINRFY